METDPFSETSYSLGFRMQDGGYSPKALVVGFGGRGIYEVWFEFF
jgi:hypothetical protein